MSFLLSIFIAGPAFASVANLNEVSAACEPPQKIKEKVYYCSENTDATAAAQRCRDALKKMWDEAPKDVNPEFAKLYKGNDGKQQVNFHDSRADYHTAMEKLYELVNVTQDKAELVAQYPVVMIDYPGAPELTAPCYNDEVDKVQGVVAEIDDMILRAKSTYFETGKLRGISGGRDGHIDSNEAASVIQAMSVQAQPPPEVRVPAGTSPRHQSDITGVRENPQDDALGSFPLRDQLTGPGR